MDRFPVTNEIDLAIGIRCAGSEKLAVGNGLRRASPGPPPDFPPPIPSALASAEPAAGSLYCPAILTRHDLIQTAKRAD